MKEINTILKEIRKRNGYTQQDIADHLEMDASNYARIERGDIDVTYKTLVKIANFYNISILELIAYPKSITIQGESIKNDIIIKIGINGENAKEKIIEVLDKIDNIKKELED